MSWILEQFSLLRVFLGTDFRRILRFTALGMALSILLGVCIGFLAPELVIESLNAFVEQIEEAGVMDNEGGLSVFALLMNNWKAMLLSAAYGFIPFLFLPVISLLTNGALIGMLGTLYAASGAVPMFLAGILPHGIFELPALVLSIACGVYLCRNMCRMSTGSPKRVPLLALLEDILRVLLLIVMPLTVAAAFTECYVTPVIIGLFSFP